jgi:hypothetical protein
MKVKESMIDHALFKHVYLILFNSSARFQCEIFYSIENKNIVLYIERIYRGGSFGGAIFNQHIHSDIYKIKTIPLCLFLSRIM